MAPADCDAMMTHRYSKRSDSATSAGKHNGERVQQPHKDEENPNIVVYRKVSVEKIYCL